MSIRWFRDLDLGPKPCFLLFTALNERSGAVRLRLRGVEHLDFVDRCKPSTKPFEDYLSVLCEETGTSDAADGSARSTPTP